MSYFQEDLNDDPFFSDETEDDEHEVDEYSLDSQSSHVFPRKKKVFKNVTVEEDSFPEEIRFNPSRPAYLQLPFRKAEIPEIDQPRRQARMNSPPKKEDGTDKNQTKEPLLGGSPVENQYTQQQSV